MSNRLSGLKQAPGRAERRVYLAAVGVLTVCLLLVIGHSYRSARQYERRLAALRQWQRDSVDAANDLHRKAAAAVGATPQARYSYPRRDDSSDIPAPVCAAYMAKEVIDELRQENERLRERPDFRPRSKREAAGAGGCVGLCGEEGERIAKLRGPGARHEGR